VCVDGADVDARACCGQEGGARDDVLKRCRGEPLRAVRRQQGKRLDVDGVVRGVGRGEKLVARIQLGGSRLACQSEEWVGVEPTDYAADDLGPG